MKKLLVLLSLTTSFSIFAGEILKLTEDQQSGMQAEIASAIKRANVSCEQVAGTSYDLPKQEFNDYIQSLAAGLLEGRITSFRATNPDDGAGYAGFTHLKKGTSNGILTEYYSTVYVPFLKGAMSYNSFYMQYSRDRTDVREKLLISSEMEFKAHCHFLK